MTRPPAESRPPPLDPVRTPAEQRRRALIHAAINQLAFPGLGSIMAGRRVGYPQAFVMVLGFLLTVGYFVGVIAQMLQSLSQGPAADTSAAAPWKQHALYGLLGLGLSAVAWIWSLVTSISLLRRASSNS